MGFVIRGGRLSICKTKKTPVLVRLFRFCPRHKRLLELERKDLWSDRLQKLRNDLIGIDPICLGLEVHEHAMAEDGEGDGANVIQRRNGTAIEQRRRFCAEN